MTATTTARLYVLEPPRDPVPEGLKVPKTLAECADLLYKTRASRLAKDKEAEKLKNQETFLTNFIIDNLPKSNAEGVTGKVCRVELTRKEKPTVTDWDALYKYIKRTGAFELLQRRLTEAAIKERWEARKEVPGVGRWTDIGLSITKR